MQNTQLLTWPYCYNEFNA